MTMRRRCGHSLALPSTARAGFSPAHTLAASQLPYYHNPRTKVTQWERPAKPKQGFSTSVKNFFDKPVAETTKAPGDSRRVSVTAIVSNHKVAMSGSI